MPEGELPAKNAGEQKEVKQEGAVSGEKGGAKPKKLITAQWWFWAIIGVVVVAVAVIIVIAVVGKGSDKKDSDRPGGGDKGNSSKVVEKDEEEDKDAEDDGDNGGTSTHSGGTTDWRKFADEYAAWVDSYVTFMLKYKGNLVGMAQDPDYARWSKEVSEWSDKADAIDVESMTMAEAMEFAAAMSKIAERLLEVL